jgi:hypothetical protein
VYYQDFLERELLHKTKTVTNARVPCVDGIPSIFYGRHHDLVNRYGMSNILLKIDFYILYIIVI